MSGDRKTLRVLMVSDVYFPRINGVSTSIQSFRHALAHEGVEVTLIAPRYGDEPEEMNIDRVSGWVLPRDPEDRLLRWGETSRAVEIAAKTVDLIHIQTPFVAHYAGLRAARRLNKPVLATYHTLFEEYLQHYIPLVPSAMLRAATRRFSRGQCNALNAVVVPSTAMRDRLLSYGVTTPLRVLPTGIPLSAFAGGSRARFRAAHGIDPNRPVAIFVGRLGHEKNISFLLHALTRVHRERPDALLLLMGEGPSRGHLEAEVERLGLHNQVRFLGYLDRATELPDAYAAADLMVFASRTETQGLVLLEAMAAGCPVLGLAAMGTADILLPQRGCRVAADDANAFADDWLDLIKDPEALAALSAEAPIYAGEWSAAAMARRMADLYRELL